MLNEQFVSIHCDSEYRWRSLFTDRGIVFWLWRKTGDVVTTFPSRCLTVKWEAAGLEGTATTHALNLWELREPRAKAVSFSDVSIS